MLIWLQTSAARGFSLALAVAGGVLLAGGAKLLLLGGSWWYLAAGATLLASAVLLWRGNRWGAWLYGLLLLVTAIWSLWEVGLAPWGLLPRLGLLVLGGLWLLTPPGYRTLRATPAALLSPRARGGVWVAILLLAITLVGVMLVGRHAPARAADAAISDAAALSGDWLQYGGDTNATRYSPLAQIGPANVAGLQLAWSVHTGDQPRPGKLFRFEATPLKVGRLLYLCTPGGRVLALDAQDGQRAWEFDPHAENPQDAATVCRGVTYGEPQGVTGACTKRIYAALNSQLWALDALTGKPCADFGQSGVVDLKQGLGIVLPGIYKVTSPPIITRNRIVIGAAVDDGVSIDIPSGVVRAYDARSGALAWAWDVGHLDRRGAPPAGETYTRSTPNVWAPMVADDAAGLIYLPTGNPASDHYGGRWRDFDEAFASSLVAIDAETGSTRWKFQITHHDLWDFNLSSQPTLFDLPGPAGPRPAIAIGSKSGSIFVLDRLTGAPIVPVVEKPVPHQSALETKLSATQPESGLVANPGAATLREASMWGITPFDQLWCRIQFRSLRYDGPYTPPGTERESLVYPGMFGGIEWGSLAVDPVRDMLIANPSAMPFRLHLEKIGEPNATGLPYSQGYYAFLSPLNIPCMQPPWGGLIAFDLQSQQILWSRPVGSTTDSGPFGIASHLPLLIGTPQVGGAIVTKSGLIFSAATVDRYLRAYDLKTGDELWKARLPAGGQATPMTYAVDGRQYILIAAGGHDQLGTRTGDYVQAWALPSPASAAFH